MGWIYLFIQIRLRKQRKGTVEVGKVEIKRALRARSQSPRIRLQPAEILQQKSSISRVHLESPASGGASMASQLSMALAVNGGLDRSLLAKTYRCYYYYYYYY